MKPGKTKDVDINTENVIIIIVYKCWQNISLFSLALVPNINTQITY